MVSTSFSMPLASVRGRMAGGWRMRIRVESEEKEEDNEVKDAVEGVSED